MCQTTRLSIILALVLPILCEETKDSLTPGSTALKFLLGQRRKSAFVLVQDGSPNLLEDFGGTLSENVENMQIQPKRRYQTFVVQNIHNGVSNSTNNTFKVSEEMLKTRWKVMKYRFHLSTVIMSENLVSISKVLRLYGPNVTEKSNILVIISQKAFEDQQGPSKFQRDMSFWKMYAALALLQFGQGDYKFQVICPLCPDALLPPPLIFTPSFRNSNYESLYLSIHKLNSDYNERKGHGSTALLCRIGVRGPAIIDTKYHREAELTARRRYDRHTDKNGIMLGILINIFNFTIKQEDWIEKYEEGNYSGIYITPGGDKPEFFMYGRRMTITHSLNEFFLYCRKVAIIPATGWDFLWAPFDLPTWAGILITCVSFFLFNTQRKVSYGLDVFWAVLGLPTTANWAKSKFLSFFLVVVINLNIGYLSVITSKVIMPNKEEDIATPTELFRQGFRFINRNATEAVNTGFVKYYNVSLQKFDIDSSISSNVIVTVNNCSETHNPVCISKWAGLATGLLYLHQKAENFLKVDADMRDRCHGVKHPFRTYWVIYYSQGPLASAIYDTHQYLISTGIDLFWERLMKASSVYVAFRQAGHLDGDGDPPKLSFETPILVVFKAYGVLISVCVVGFCIEVLIYFISRKFKQNSKNSKILSNTSPSGIIMILPNNSRY